jgi:hypothetical protein
MSKNMVLTKQSKKNSKQQTPISRASSLAEIGAFWDTHDFADYEDHCPDVTDRIRVNIRRVRHYVAIEPEILRRATRAARKRGMSAEGLINLWVKEAASRS